MLTAFILISTEVGKEEMLNSKLKLIARIKGIYIIFGAYDAIIKIEAGTLSYIKATLNEIKKIAEIKSMKTLLAL